VKVLYTILLIVKRIWVTVGKKTDGCSAILYRELLPKHFFADVGRFFTESPFGDVEILRVLLAPCSCLVPAHIRAKTLFYNRLKSTKRGRYGML
jgi:hypothetical protein